MASGCTSIPSAESWPVKAVAPSEEMTTEALGAITVPPGNGACTNNVDVPAYPSTVVWTAKDGAGNVATAIQTVTAELGNDPSCCPAGTHVIVGTSNNDTLVGTSGADCILGLGGQDTISGGDGDDFISGGDGDDLIFGVAARSG